MSRSAGYVYLVDDDFAVRGLQLVECFHHGEQVAVVERPSLRDIKSPGNGANFALATSACATC